MQIELFSSLSNEVKYANHDLHASLVLSLNLCVLCQMSTSELIVRTSYIDRIGQCVVSKETIDVWTARPSSIRILHIV